MSLRRPTYAPSVATDRGWVHEQTGELLVSHSNLLTKLANAGLDEYAKPVKKVAPKKTSPKKSKANTGSEV